LHKQLLPHFSRDFYINPELVPDPYQRATIQIHAIRRSLDDTRPESGYNHHMATIHISSVEASRDFAGLLAMVRSGAEIIIEDGAYPPAVLRSAEPVRRTISECIEMARKHEEETGESPVIDPDFAEDVAEILRRRRSIANPESRRVGFMAGQGSVGPEFFDPLPDEELRLWNCEEDESTP
jgi:hypothetical protein